MQRPNKLTVEWLVENNMPLYVKNMTRPRGQVVLTITLPNGKNKSLKVPKTFIPVCLSEHAPKEVLASCYDLQQYVLKGILELQHPQDALNELNSEDSADELRKLQLSEYSSLSKWTSKNQEIEQPQLTEGQFDVDDEDPVQAISPRVMQLVESHLGEDLSAKELLNELRIIETDLTDVDCSYVIQNGPAGQVREFVQKILAKNQKGGTQESLPTVPAEYDISEDDGDDSQAEAERARLARAAQDSEDAKKIALDEVEQRMKSK